MVVRISGRAEALNNANAPLDDLFDFVPRADSKWICKPNQWNNTRKGSCSFTKHEAVSPTVLNAYQGAVPLLGNYIPSWATVDPLKQGVSSGSVQNMNIFIFKDPMGKYDWGLGLCRLCFAPMYILWNVTL